MRSFFLLTAIVISVSAPMIVAGQDGHSKTVHSIDLPVIQTELKPGPGLEKVSTLCNICHSVDYITMQPKFSRATWTAEVNKMVKVMGAPINEEDAKAITEYLVHNYGTGD